MTISIEQAQLRLVELVERSASGEQIVITRDGDVVAQIVPAGEAATQRQPGFAKDIIEIVADDDEHLEQFREYMK
jgi:prevent-host-death family protein